MHSKVVSLRNFLRFDQKPPKNRQKLAWNHRFRGQIWPKMPTHRGIWTPYVHKIKWRWKLLHIWLEVKLRGRTNTSWKQKWPHVSQFSVFEAESWVLGSKKAQNPHDLKNWFFQSWSDFFVRYTIRRVSASAFQICFQIQKIFTRSKVIVKILFS